MIGFPKIRMRQRRKDEAVRRRYRQTPVLSPKDLIMPLFVKEALSRREAIASMPGICQLSIKESVIEARKIYSAGVPGVILFGIPKHKDETGSGAYAQNGVVQEAIRLIKKTVPGLEVIADVCMCEYTSHGHCGIIKCLKPKVSSRKLKNKELVPSPYPLAPVIIDNDATIEVLAKIAVSYACAGADVVAPSAMMDGQVRAIKQALLKNYYPKVKIMSYSAKYASNFYAPFRDAAQSPPQFGDRRTYQMDYHNSDEAVLEAGLDIQEGADTIMVKPALGYQDIIYRLKKELKFPLVCYSVSGEYAMLKAAAAGGYLDEEKTVLEVLTGFKRGGADFIITYYALEAAKWLKNK